MNTKTLGYIPSDKADFDYPKLKSGWEGSERNVAAQSTEHGVRSTDYRTQNIQYGVQCTEYRIRACSITYRV